MDRYGDLFRLVVELSESRAISVAYFALVASFVTVHSHRQRIASDLRGKSSGTTSEGSVVSANDLPTSWIRIFYLDGSHLSIRVSANTTIREICVQICLELKLGLYEVEQELGSLNDQKLLPANMTVGELIARWKAMRWPDAKLVAPVYLKDWAYQLSSRALRRVRFENSYLTETLEYDTPASVQDSPETPNIVIRRNERGNPIDRQSPVSDTSASVTPPMRARQRTHALLNALFTTREVADPRELSATVAERRWEDTLRRPSHSSPVTPTIQSNHSNGNSSGASNGTSSGRRGTYSPVSPAVSTVAVASSTPIATPLAVPVQGRESVYTPERAASTPVAYQGQASTGFTPLAASATASTNNSAHSTPAAVRSAHRNGVPTAATATSGGQSGSGSGRRRVRQTSPAVIATQPAPQERRGIASSPTTAEVAIPTHPEEPAVQVTPPPRCRDAASSAPPIAEQPRSRGARPSPAVSTAAAAAPQSGSQSNGPASITPSTLVSPTTPEPAPRRVSRSARESSSAAHHAGGQHGYAPSGHSNTSINVIRMDAEDGRAGDNDEFPPAPQDETPDKVRPRTTVVKLAAASRSRTPSPNRTGHAAQQHQHQHQHSAVVLATTTVIMQPTPALGTPVASAAPEPVAARENRPVTDIYPSHRFTSADASAALQQESEHGRDSPATTASTLSTTNTPRHGHTTSTSSPTGAAAHPTNSPNQRQSQAQSSSPTRLMASPEDIAIHTAHARTNALLNKLFGNYPVRKQEPGSVEESLPGAEAQAASTTSDQDRSAVQPAPAPQSGEDMDHVDDDRDHHYPEEDTEIDGTQTPPPNSRPGHHSQHSSGTFTLSRSTSPGTASVVSTAGSLHSTASGLRSQTRRRLAQTPTPVEPVERPPFDTTVSAPTLSMLLALGQAEHGIGWQPRIVLDKKTTPSGSKNKTLVSKSRSFPTERSPKDDRSYSTPVKDHSGQLLSEGPAESGRDGGDGDVEGQGEDVRVRLFPTRRGSTGSTPPVRSGSASKIPVRRGTTLGSPTLAAAPVTSPVPVPTRTTTLTPASARAPRTPTSNKGLTPSRSLPHMRGSPRPLSGVNGTVSPRGSFIQRRGSAAAADTPASARKLRAVSPAVSITSAEHSSHSRHQSPFDFERRPPQNPHAAFGRTVHPITEGAPATVGTAGEPERSTLPHHAAGHSSAPQGDGNSLSVKARAQVQQARRGSQRGTK